MLNEQARIIREMIISDRNYSEAYGFIIQQSEIVASYQDGINRKNAIRFIATNRVKLMDTESQLGGFNPINYHIYDDFITELENYLTYINKKGIQDKPFSSNVRSYYQAKRNTLEKYRKIVSEANAKRGMTLEESIEIYNGISTIPSKRSTAAKRIMRLKGCSRQEVDRIAEEYLRRSE